MTLYLSIVCYMKNDIMGVIQSYIFCKFLHELVFTKKCAFIHHIDFHTSMQKFKKYLAFKPAIEQCS